MPNLVLLVGIPGCGKSTWARTYFNFKYSIVSSDAIRKRLAGSLKEAHGNDVRPWDVFYQEIEDRLTHNVDVIADATFLTTRHRDRARAIADKTGADLHLVIFKNWYAASERNEKRDKDLRVPPRIMADMMTLYWDTLVRIAQEEYKTVTKIEAFN